MCEVAERLINRGYFKAYAELVIDHVISPEEAAKRLNMDLSEFNEALMVFQKGKR